MNLDLLRNPLRVAASCSLVALIAACGQQPEAAAPATPPPTELVALQTPPPQYPLEAACSGKDGTSTLKVVVGTAGTPTEVTVLRSSGTAALDQAAVAAVKTWKFKPATRAGQPVPQTINVPVNFHAPQVRPDNCFSLDENTSTQPQK